VSDGVMLFVNIIAMLIVFTAIVALVNMSLAQLPGFLGAPLSVERVLGYAPREQVLDVVEKIVLVQRDHGNGFPRVVEQGD